MEKSFYIIDDHEMLRVGTAAYIAAHSDWSCIGSFGDGDSALADLERHARAGTLPAVIICDLNFYGEDSGFALVKHLHILYPELRIIVYSMFFASGIVQNAIQDGARGYVSKIASSDELLCCMEHVLAGEVFIQVELQEKLEQFNSFADALTRREKEVMDLLVRRLSNEQIAEALQLKRRAVENYISSIYDKIGVKDRVELMKRFG